MSTGQLNGLMHWSSLAKFFVKWPVRNFCERIQTFLGPNLGQDPNLLGV